MAASVESSVPAPGSFRALGGLPLYFEAESQRPSPSYFLARGSNYRFLLRANEARLLLQKDLSGQAPRSVVREGIVENRAVSRRTVRLRFEGADENAPMRALDQLSGKMNYLIGSDPAGWRTNLSISSKVEVENVYPGIDLVYYGNDRQLEYDFTLAPGADPATIVLQIEGADRVSINRAGELVLDLGDDQVRQHRPVLYQVENGKRRSIEGGYRMLDRGRVGFSVGAYNPRLPLVIDPILTYASYWGGNYGDIILSVKLDSTGAVYFAGQTLSTKFPFEIPPGVFQSTYQGGDVNGDCFVAKYDATGTNLVYFTYLGGRDNDGATDLAVDAAGNAYLTGLTASPDFPMVHPLFGKVHGTPDPTLNVYPTDAFVAELNAAGSGLVFSTFLGGSGIEVAGGIAVSPAGSIFVTGYTHSTNFPTVNPIPNHKKLAGANDGFVTCIGPEKTNLVYSTYLGGAKEDRGEGVAVDSEGFAYVTGYTVSTGFPITNAFQPHMNLSTNTILNYDAFVTKFYPDGGLAYSTFLGGILNDVGYRIAVDAANDVYVTGYTEQASFPNTATNLPPLFASTNASSYTQGFLTKIGTEWVTGSKTNEFGTNVYYTNLMSKVLCSAVFGGNSDDASMDVAVDGYGDAFVVGIATSYTNFPHYNTTGFLSPTNSGLREAFVLGFGPNMSEVLYAGFLGGSRDDYGYGIAVNPGGDAYIVGRTTSTNFPTLGASQTSREGANDGFVVRIGLEPRLLQEVTPGGLQFRWWAGAPDSPTYVLQSSPDLSSGSWSAVGDPPQVSNGWYTVTLPAGPINSSAFYRLRGL